MTAAQTRNRRPAGTEAAADQRNAFIPQINAAQPEWQTGERRKIEACRSSRLRWPEGDRLRRELFDAWESVAFQIISRHRATFRLVALLRRFMHWRTGTFFPTDETLAGVAGCHPKSISRDIAAYSSLGVIQIELGWRKDGVGNFRRSRVIHPSIPIDLKDLANAPLLENHMDNRGPYERCSNDKIHMDNRGPDHMDNRGPFTLEEPLKGGGTDAA